MRFDVSEMKTILDCGRKWQLSSRNAFHLRPKVMNPNLFFGSLFHECLHTLYMGGDIDKVVAQAIHECRGDLTQQRTIEAMLRGYATRVLPKDLEKYRVLDIEHSVNFYLPHFIEKNEDGTIDDEKSIRVCGSIDMICADKKTNEVWGFEHKTAAKFRPDVYLIVDEQPRVYYVELCNYVQHLNGDYYAKYKEPGPYTVGGIYINEVRKVQKSFDYLRRSCTYSAEQIDKFMYQLELAGSRIKYFRENPEACEMHPSYMGCTMCDYSSICSTYGYESLDKIDILDEFAEEYEVREVDHLDEKVERRIEG